MLISGMIKAIADMLGQFCGWRKSAVENQATSEVIDDKKDLEKASRYAENAIEVAEKYKTLFKKIDLKSFTHFVKKFRKYK